MDCVFYSAFSNVDEFYLLTAAYRTLKKSWSYDRNKGKRDLYWINFFRVLLIFYHIFIHTSNFLNCFGKIFCKKIHRFDVLRIFNLLPSTGRFEFNNFFRFNFNCFLCKRLLIMPNFFGLFRKYSEHLVELFLLN